MAGSTGALTGIGGGEHWTTIQRFRPEALWQGDQGQQRSGRPQEVPALTESIRNSGYFTPTLSRLADVHTLVRAVSSKPGSALASAVASNSSWVAMPDLPLEGQSQWSSGDLRTNLSCVTWVWSWCEWELWTGGSHLLTWVPWSGSLAHSPGARSSGGQGPPRWGPAPAAWGQRRSGRRGAALGQLGRQRHGAARACGDQNSWGNHAPITYSALDTATSLVCTSVSVRGWADTRLTATISPGDDVTWHSLLCSCYI